MLVSTDFKKTFIQPLGLNHYSKEAGDDVLTLM